MSNLITSTKSTLLRNESEVPVINHIDLRFPLMSLTLRPQEFEAQTLSAIQKIGQIYMVFVSGATTIGTQHVNKEDIQVHNLSSDLFTSLT